VVSVGFSALLLFAKVLLKVVYFPTDRLHSVFYCTLLTSVDIGLNVGCIFKFKFFLNDKVITALLSAENVEVSENLTSAWEMFIRVFKK